MKQLSQSQAESLIAQHGSPLLLVDCASVRERALSLQAALPHVDLMYAVKAFPDSQVIKELNALGIGFDIASNGEVDLLRAQRVNPRRCIHTHPIKKDQDIRGALRFGCTTFVVDNIAELEKLKPYRHRVGVLLRLSFVNPDALVDLSRKFGCSLGEVENLLKYAQDLGINVKGFSFHVGSQCKNGNRHVEAIQASAALFERYSSAYPSLSVLDIGGGFPAAYDGDSQINIDDFCAPIRAALSQLPNYISCLAEPGRYLVAESACSIASVVGKAERAGTTWIYLDDGVYGSYSGQIFDGVKYPLSVFSEAEALNCVLAGPTCDSIDVIRDNVSLPALSLGDLVIGYSMGAYTKASATHFNAIAPAETVYVNVGDEAQVAYIA